MSEAGRGSNRLDKQDAADLRILVALGRVGIRTNDRELGRRALSILREFSAVSEGPAASPPSLALPTGQPILCPSCKGTDSDSCHRCRGRGTIREQGRHRSVKPHHESHAPGGSSGSAFSHYLRWFAGAKDDGTLWARVREAEAQHVVLTGRTDSERTDTDSGQARARAVAASFGDDGAEMEEIQARRILERYPGKTAERVAELEGDRRLAPWVQKIRQIAKNPRRDELGRPTSDWEGWDRQTRVRAVRELRGRHFTVTQIADHLRIPRSTAHDYAKMEETHPRKQAA